MPEETPEKDEGTMLEVGPKHSLEYRQEILSRLFAYIDSTESCYLIGAPSVGKTRLLDFMMRPKVKRHYLQDRADHTWLIRVDLNRLPAKQQEWAFYELLLSSIFLALDGHPDIDTLQPEIVDLDHQVIQSKDLWLALRFFELAVFMLCHRYEMKVCFLFDEFDEAYRTLPREMFAELRAIRDANKNRLSYAVFMRALPEMLRSPKENEGFYELISRNMIGMGPYSPKDSMSSLQQMEARRNHALNPLERQRLIEASGGHPGILQALLSVCIENPRAPIQLQSAVWLDWLAKQEAVQEECRKLREGLSEAEWNGLAAFTQGKLADIPAPIGKILFAKGLVRRSESELCIFSPLLERYIRSYSKQPVV